MSNYGSFNFDSSNQFLDFTLKKKVGDATDLSLKTTGISGYDLGGKIDSKNAYKLTAGSVYSQARAASNNTNGGGNAGYSEADPLELAQQDTRAAMGASFSSANTQRNTAPASPAPKTGEGAAYKGAKETLNSELTYAGDRTGANGNVTKVGYDKENDRHLEVTRDKDGNFVSQNVSATRAEGFHELELDENNEFVSHTLTSTDRMNEKSFDKAGNKISETKKFLNKQGREDQITSNANEEISSVEVHNASHGGVKYKVDIDPKTGEKKIYRKHTSGDAGEYKQAEVSAALVSSLDGMDTSKMSEKEKASFVKMRDGLKADLAAKNAAAQGTTATAAKPAGSAEKTAVQVKDEAPVNESQQAVAPTEAQIAEMEKEKAEAKNNPMHTLVRKEIDIAGKVGESSDNDELKASLKGIELKKSTPPPKKGFSKLKANINKLDERIDVLKEKDNLSAAEKEELRMLKGSKKVEKKRYKALKRDVRRMKAKYEGTGMTDAQMGAAILEKKEAMNTKMAQLQEKAKSGDLSAEEKQEYMKLKSDKTYIVDDLAKENGGEIKVQWLANSGNLTSPEAMSVLKKNPAKYKEAVARYQYKMAYLGSGSVEELKMASTMYGKKISGELDAAPAKQTEKKNDFMDDFFKMFMANPEMMQSMAKFMAKENSVDADVDQADAALKKAEETERVNNSTDVE